MVRMHHSKFGCQRLSWVICDRTTLGASPLLLETGRP
jgi:hypothetical protein